MDRAALVAYEITQNVDSVYWKIYTLNFYHHLQMKQFLGGQ